MITLTRSCKVVQLYIYLSTKWVQSLSLISCSVTLTPGILYFDKIAHTASFASCVPISVPYELLPCFTNHSILAVELLAASASQAFVEATTLFI